MRQTKRLRIPSSQIGIWLVLAGVTSLVLLPLLWAIKSMFTPSGEIFSTGWLAKPTYFTLDNLTRGLAAAPFDVYFRNSFKLAIAVTTAIVVTSALAGYGFAKFRFRGNSVLFGLVIMAMLMPFQAILIPLFVEVTKFGWIDSMRGLIIPGSVSAFGIFMMRQFMSSIPTELIEAALIDGCSPLRVFWVVILPLAKSSLAALGSLAFLASWNNYLWPLVIVQNVETMTVPLGLAQFRGANATDYGAVFAVSLVAAVPVILLFIIMSRQIVSSFAMSGIK
jgi:ABC-type glycerol-3-phosphate transport system permease component